jgi:hypothetical protein
MASFTFPFDRASDLAIGRLAESGYLDDSVGANPVLATLLYGSRVYDTASDDSDYDVFIVIDSDQLTKEIDEEFGIHHLEGNDADLEISIVSSRLFDQMLGKCEVRAIESVFTPAEFIGSGQEWIQGRCQMFAEKLETDRAETLNKIRSAFSGVSSNSEVKARKKVLCGEYMIGLKSVFHSVRLLMFGLQLGLTGKILDFSQANHVWEEIETELVPKIADDSLVQGDSKAIYKKYAKTQYQLEGEARADHLLTRFKLALPKL